MITFISVETLKIEYLIDDNLDEKYLLSNIKKAQDFSIRPLIGDELYNEIELQIKDNSLTDKNKDLLIKYIEPIIAYYVMSEVVYSTAYKLKNQGLSGDEKSDQYRFSELVKISTKYLNDSRNYEELFKLEMCETGLPIGEDYEFKSPFHFGLNNTCGYNTIAHKNNKPPYIK